MDNVQSSPSPLMKYLRSSADASAPSTPVKIEEYVIVMDAISAMPPKLHASKERGGELIGMSSPLMMSSDPVSGGGIRGENCKLRKYALCHFWPAGMCRYGSDCQYAHGMEESSESGTIKIGVPKLSNITLEGSVSSSHGAKHSPISQIKASPSTPQHNLTVPNTTLPISQWTPQDDGIQVTLPSGEKNPSKKDVNKHIEEVLYRKKPGKKRLPVFKAICPD